MTDGQQCEQGLCAFFHIRTLTQDYQVPQLAASMPSMAAALGCVELPDI